MFKIVYGPQNTNTMHKVECDLLLAAQIIWDALNTAGYSMFSTRP